MRAALGLGESFTRTQQALIDELTPLGEFIVGKIETGPRYAKCTGFVNARQDMFSIMGNARSVVSTSVLDTAPGILFEAAIMGCNVIASHNCGNWRLCHPDLLVDPYIRKGFVQSIRLSAQEKFSDNLDHFLDLNSYQDLLDAVAVL